MAKIIKIGSFIECNRYKRPGGVTPICDHPSGPALCNGFDKDCPLPDAPSQHTQAIADAARAWLKHLDKTNLPNSLDTHRMQEKIVKAIGKEQADENF